LEGGCVLPGWEVSPDWVIFALVLAAGEVLGGEAGAASSIAQYVELLWTRSGQKISSQLSFSHLVS
jgi:hypothetical protein